MKIFVSEIDRMLCVSVVTIAVLVLLLWVTNIAYSQTTTISGIISEPKLNEDQVIICVTDVSNSSNRGHLNCHEFTVDDVDWYQEISEQNYGKFGNTDDSFEMVTID